MRHDVTFPLYVEVDEIYNLACPASPIHYQHDPVQTTKTSVHGAINMLGLAKRLQAPIFQASTSEVYGDPAGPPADRGLLGQRQSDRASARATTRASAAPRRCSSTITASTGCEIKVARIFNTYGPRMHPNDGRVVSNFIVQALKGEPITIYGDGSQTRSFCYVDDLIEAFVAADGDRPKIHRADQSRQPDEFTILELAEKVISYTGLALEDHVQAAAAGRSEAAPARHLPGEGAAGLGAEGRARRRAEEDHRLFQALARTVVGRTAPISFRLPRVAARCP